MLDRRQLLGLAVEMRRKLRVELGSARRCSRAAACRSGRRRIARSLPARACGRRPRRRRRRRSAIRTGPAARTRATAPRRHRRRRACGRRRGAASRGARRAAWGGPRRAGQGRSRPVVHQVRHLDRHAAPRRGPCPRRAPRPGPRSRTVSIGVGDRQVVVERDARDRGAALVGDQLEVIGLAADRRSRARSARRTRRSSASACRATPISSAPGTRTVAMSVGGDAERGELDHAGRGDPVGDAGVEARLDDADAQLAPSRRAASPRSALRMRRDGGGRRRPAARPRRSR